ncbi:restriction endonuclease subunit S [Photorhabdus temperata]|uniref:Type I restriction modification DNA specificity domain-containing protein n=1 Tax=Photorhabdus temperata J3 TaxID=1389415 RepID=U7QWG1_PHOTE|nr:restriction endonuclease subunit S [Photorhabdus temperata]ERT12359.1 hypothetical protein O185_14630 [Photorhabdus temperata J3]
MSNMSFMEKLLDGAEIKWEPLGQVLVRTKGTKITAGQMKELHKDGAPLKVFAGGRTIAFVNFEDIPAKNINREPSIIVKSRGVIEFEYYDKPFTHKNEMWSYYSKNDEINIKYVYYILKLNEPHFQSLGSKMQMPQIATPDTDKFQIPIPPFHIQEEIVRILDAFTELTAELIAELTARKKQYNYYRDQLLSFEEGEVEWKTLGEMCTIGVGQAPNVNELGDYPFVNAGTTPSGYLSTYNTESDVITTPSRGQGGIGYVGYQKNRFWCGPLCYRIRSKSELITTRFLFYVMSNSMKNIIGLANMAGVPALNKKDLVGFSVPVPKLALQERIVSILDKFDDLTSSISEGLPREIELRQKQYEYYRDLLLSFPKPEVAA